MLRKLIIDKDIIDSFEWSHLREILSLKTENDESLLHVAVKNRSLDMVKHLLNERICLNTIDEYDKTAFDIEFLLNESDIESKDNKGNTPLHVAARNACLEIFKLLLERDANFHAVNDCRETVLHLSVFDSSNNEILDFALNSSLIKVNVKNSEGETTLHKAIIHKNLEAVQLLLTQEKIDIESKDNQGNTPLLIAAKFLSLEIFNLLLEKGADVNAVNLSGETVLHEAIRYKNVEVVKFLLTLEEIDIEMRNNERNTPLLIAAASLSLETFYLLLEKGADVSAFNDYGETVLHLLVEDRNKETFYFVRKLLSTPEINVNAKNRKGETILHKAIRFENLEVVKLLLTHDEIDIKTSDSKGNTPLFVAAAPSRLETFHLLLKKDADVTAINDSNETVLHLLVQHRNEERFDIVFKLLSTREINVNFKNLKGESALHSAVRRRNVQAVKVLLTYEEIDIESKDKEENTPLLIAVTSFNANIFHLLLEKGADVNATNKSGETILHWLVQYCNKEIFELVCKLLSMPEINVNVKDLKGETILHKAIRSKNVEVVEKLVTNEGIDAECRDSQGNTPLQVAETLNLKNVQLLLTSKATINSNLSAD